MAFITGWLLEGVTQIVNAQIDNGQTNPNTIATKVLNYYFHHGYNFHKYKKEIKQLAAQALQKQSVKQAKATGDWKDRLDKMWQSYKREHPDSKKPPESLVEKAKAGGPASDSGPEKEKKPLTRAEREEAARKKEDQKYNEGTRDTLWEMQHGYKAAVLRVAGKYLHKAAGMMEDLPTRERMRPSGRGVDRYRERGGDPWGGLTFSALPRFLASRVGKSWDRVYSEIVSRWPSEEGGRNSLRRFLPGLVRTNVMEVGTDEEGQYLINRDGSKEYTHFLSKAWLFYVDRQGRLQVLKNR